MQHAASGLVCINTGNGKAGDCLWPEPALSNGSRMASTREYSFGKLTHAGKPVALPTTAVEGLGFLSIV